MMLSEWYNRDKRKRQRCGHSAGDRQNAGDLNNGQGEKAAHPQCDPPGILPLTGPTGVVTCDR